MGLDFLMGREERTEQIPPLCAAHTHWLATAPVSVSYESVRFSVREAISERQRRMSWITGLFSVRDSDVVQRDDN